MIGKKINQLATELAPVSTNLTIIGDPTTGVSKKITLAQLGAIFSGAVSFYTNLAGFPATGDINVIYCAKDTQKLYLWSGSAYVEVFPSQALLDTYQLRSEKGVSNGYASLDSSGKVPISQLPSSIMEYKGTWNAATNTPTLANGTGDTGDVYICNVAGTVNFGAGAITFAVGDYVIYSGTIWQRSSGAVGTVTSVAASITGNAIGITGSPVTTSGTLAFAFAGTGAQYIKGDGTLATFPSTIAQAERLITEVYNSTGATLTKGTIVYINGGQGNLPTVTKALATGDSTSAQTFGVVQADITNNNNGYVVVAGKLSDLDTQAYTEGTQLYLSSTTAGAWTSTKQYAPAHLVYVGIIVRSHPTQGIVEIKIQNGYELDELHNVAAQTPTNNDGLFWEASTSLWKNKSIATILGGTPVTGSGNVNAIPKFTANSVLGNSVMEDDGNFVSMRGLKLNAVAGVGNTINFQQGSGITAAGLGYSTIGAASTTGFVFYIDQNTTSRSFILDTSTITSATQLTYSLPASTGTLALVSQLTGGTVTSVGLSVPTGFAVSGSPVTSSGTLALAFDTGYSLPTIVKQNNWDTAYNTRIVTASSPLSFISNTISISQASGSANGFLSSTDWTTFNNKQAALTNPVTGTGTTNYLPKFTGTSTIGNSVIQEASSNIGIGVSPSYKLDVYDASTDAVAFFNSGNANGSHIRFGASGTVKNFVGNSAGFITSGSIDDLGLRAVGSIRFATNGAGTDMILDASGNLGLGVSPSAGLATANYRLFEIGLDGGGSIYSGSNQTLYGTNISWVGGTPNYVRTGSAPTLYNQSNGAHSWSTAPTGTAGNAISFTQAMTLYASGNLSIGNTNDTYKLDVTGTGRFGGTNTYNGFLIGSHSNNVGAAIYNKALANATLYADSASTVLNAETNLYLRTGNTDRLTIASTGAATFSSSVTAGGDVNIPNGNYYYAKRSTGGANIGVLGFASGSDTLSIKGGTSGSGVSIQFEDTGGVIAGFNNGRLGIGTTSPGSLLHTSGSSNIFKHYTTANNGTWVEFQSNSAGRPFYVGQDNSTGASFFGAGYAGLIVTGAADPIVFGTNSTERMRIKSNGIINLSNVPSSSAGLSSGDIYKTVAGVLMIV